MNIFFRVTAFVLVLAAAVFVPFKAYPETSAPDKKPVKTEEYKTALNLWHIDTFEGGTGSRADFLNDVITAREEDGIIVLVKTYTLSGMKAAFQKGEFPDIISFGIGAGEVIKYARELPQKGFAGGEFGKKQYAVPWCAGGYYLIEKGEDNRLIDGFLNDNDSKNSENRMLIVSQGENTMPVVALKLSGVTAENVSYYPPSEAYVKFLGEQNAVLAGTQRDLRRLEKRGIAFTAKPLHGYSDIVQYLSVTAESDEKYKYALKIVDYILSEDVQKKLYKISMMRADGGKTDGEFYGYDFSENEYTASPFLFTETIMQIQSAQSGRISGDNLPDNIKSCLKRLK